MKKLIIGVILIESFTIFGALFFVCLGESFWKAFLYGHGLYMFLIFGWMVLASFLYGFHYVTGQTDKSDTWLDYLKGDGGPGYGNPF